MNSQSTLAAPDVYPENEPLSQYIQKLDAIISTLLEQKVFSDLPPKQHLKLSDIQVLIDKEMGKACIVHVKRFDGTVLGMCIELSNISRCTYKIECYTTRI